MILLFAWLFISLLVLGIPCLLLGIAFWIYPTNFLHKRMWWWYALWCNQLGWLARYYVPDLEYKEAKVGDGAFIIVANHYCWLDILILFGTVFQKRSFVFVMKRSLRFVPMIGILSSLVGYPLIDRGRAGRRNKAILMQCAKRAADYGYGIMIFPEGTRKVKVEEKHPDYEHLLAPKWMGVDRLASQMGSNVTVLDASIVYEKERPSLWDFLWGTVGKVKVEVESIQVPSEDVKSWLLALWAKKDQKMALMKSQF